MMKSLFFRFLFCVFFGLVSFEVSAQTNLNLLSDPTKQTGNGASADFVSPTQARDRYLRQVAPIKQNSYDSSAIENNALIKERPPEPDTAFQRFVAQSIGKKLPLFGYDLFGQTRFDAAQSYNVPADYSLVRGDEINVNVWGAIDANLRLVIDPAGKVFVPRVGEISLLGVKASQLEAVMKAHIAKVFNNFSLSANVGQLRRQTIFIVGHAKTPGAYVVPGLTTFIGALFMSEGPAATGSLRNIVLKRGSTVVSTLDLYRFITEGDTSADVLLQAGDVIVIPPASEQVAVTGSATVPAIFELKGTETLSQVLSYANPNAKLSSPKVVIERLISSQPQAPRSVIEVSLDAQGLKTTLSAGDIVRLSPISPRFSNAVTLTGNVAQALRYPHTPNMKVSDLIPEPAALVTRDYYSKKNELVEYEQTNAAGIKQAKNSGVTSRYLSARVNWNYALIERLNPQTLKTELLPFNLGRAVLERVPQDDLVLLPGDVVTIFALDDFAQPESGRTHFIEISGEVATPGVYEILAGQTLTDVIAKAGGLTKSAYIYGSVLKRLKTKAQQKENIKRILPQLQADIQAESSRLLQNANSTEAQTSLQQSLSQKRGIIDQLEKADPEGRVSLEINPTRPVLPALSLEDGDTFYVPSTPSFVDAIGAVNAQTSFLYRDHFTVGDVLKKAGPRTFADLSNLVIFRADGSALTQVNLEQSSWFANIQSQDVFPGDAVFVPEKLDKRDGYTKFIQGAKDWTTLLYQFGLGAAAFKVLNN